MIPLVFGTYLVPNQPVSPPALVYEVKDIYQPIRSWVDHLEEYECKDCGPHFRRVDSNGYYSYGCLQFQKATFISYSKRYDLVENEDIDTSIYDCKVQKQIAVEMIKEDPRNWMHWQNSVLRGLGKPPKI